jgi:hypothetical protein
MLIMIVMSLKNVKRKKMCGYVSPYNSMLTLFSRAVYLCDVIYKCLSWGSDQQQDLGKPSQAIDRKLLSVLSQTVGEKTQSAFEKGTRMDSFAAVLPTPGYSSSMRFSAN